MRVVLRALFRVRVEGAENLPRDATGRPAGGWICAGVPHRTWVEPCLAMAVLPGRPRPVFVADGPTVTRGWGRRFATRLIGGAIAVRRAATARDFAGQLEATARVVQAGAVLVVFPETGGPAHPPQLRRLSAGVAHMAAAGGAPVVPLAFGGTDEPYLRRPIVVRVLPALPPPTDTSRAAIGTWMARFAELAQVAASEVEQAAESAAEAVDRRRWRWLRGNFPRAR